MKYGATCAYSQMLYADKIVDDEEYIDAFLPDIDVNFEHSRPLIVQLCGNDPKILSSAVAKLLTYKNFIDGIDFNLGSFLLVKVEYNHL
jgi:tRNA-dihydrouridine synthase 1